MSKQNATARHAAEQPRTLAKITTTVAVTGGLVGGLGVIDTAGAAPRAQEPSAPQAHAAAPFALEAFDVVDLAKARVVATRSTTDQATTPPKIVERATRIGAAVHQAGAPTKVSRSQVRAALNTTPSTAHASAQAADAHPAAGGHATKPAAGQRHTTEGRQGTSQTTVSRHQVRHAVTTRQAETRSQRTQARAAVATPQRQAAPRTASPSTSGVVGIASTLTGIPYVYGGSTPSGFDCSGFVAYVYGQAGIQLPHQSGAIKAMTTPVSDPRPGDLVFLPGHVAIYAGNGKVYEARHPGALSGLYPVLPGSTYGRL